MCVTTKYAQLSLSIFSEIVAFNRGSFDTIFFLTVLVHLKNISEVYDLTLYCFPNLRCQFFDFMYTNKMFRNLLSKLRSSFHWDLYLMRNIKFDIDMSSSKRECQGWYILHKLKYRLTFISAEGLVKKLFYNQRSCVKVLRVEIKDFVFLLS